MAFRLGKEKCKTCNVSLSTCRELHNPPFFNTTTEKFQILHDAKKIGHFSNQTIYDLKGLNPAKKSDLHKMHKIATLIRTLCKRGYLGKDPKSNIQDQNVYFIKLKGLRWLNKRIFNYDSKRNIKAFMQVVF